VKPSASYAVNKIFKTDFIGKKLYYLDSVGSTQDAAKSFASAGAEEGTVVIAKTQTAGRGRFGAGWSSPPGGLWLSIILLPQEKLKPGLITLAGAVACADAIRSSSGLEAVIKWPNDCFVNGRKAAGIMGEKSGKAVIAGFGINLNVKAEDFPPELIGKAASLSLESGSEINENMFLGVLLKGFEKLYSEASHADAGIIISRLMELSGIQGRSVSGFRGKQRVEGTAEGFGEDGSLIIRLDSGILMHFSSGEIGLDKEKTDV
jgi:BirA family transcriptional regulator, biotin operon repressor / biotin---[acetyl-CoA-carboxylase] ligase